jgi:hypothetical protein
MQKSKTIHFIAEDFPLPPASSINIYGSTTITGEQGVAGQTNYVSIDNNGHRINNGT